MKHKCDNCEHKYTNNSGSGICLMFNSYEQACEAYNAETCPYAEPKMTNYDRIKAMSVEEMAEFYVDLIMQQKCVLGELERASAVVIAAVKRDLFVHAVAWLESEVQEE